LEFEETIMRDFEINEAQSRQAFGRFSRLVRVVTNWRMRKTLKHLCGFSDHQLRDIGISRHELNRLGRLPLDTDMAWDMERRTMLQSRYENVDASFLALPISGRAASHSGMAPVWITPAKAGEPPKSRHIAR
jgi:uncharacterized protein YjiS (DUF1127 family)